MEDQQKATLEVFKKSVGDFFMPMVKSWTLAKTKIISGINGIFNFLVTNFVDPLKDIFKPLAIIIAAPFILLWKVIKFAFKISFMLKSVIFNAIILPFRLVGKAIMFVFDSFQMIKSAINIMSSLSGKSVKDVQKTITTMQEVLTRKFGFLGAGIFKIIMIFVTFKNKVKEVFSSFSNLINLTIKRFLAMKDAIFTVFNFDFLGDAGSGIMDFIVRAIKTPFEWVLKFMGFVVGSIGNLVRSIMGLILLLPEFIGKSIGNVLKVLANAKFALDQIINSTIFTKELITKGLTGARAAFAERSAKSKEQRVTAVRQAGETGQGIAEKINTEFLKALRQRSEEEEGKPPAPVEVMNADELATANAKKSKKDKQHALSFEEKLLIKNFQAVK